MQLVNDARKYQSASTKASQSFYISSFILFGNNGELQQLKVLDENGEIKNVSMPTLEEFKGDFWPPDDYSYRLLSLNEHGPIKMLNNDIGYADLTNNLRKPAGDSIINMLKKTKAFIFDLRGYPHIYFDFEFLLKTLTKNAKIPGGGKEITLAPTSPNIVSIRLNSVEHTNITMTYHDWSTNYKGWVYPGKVVVLTNESAQSAAEAFSQTIKDRANATIIGSPTAGANGGVAQFNIPGGLTLYFSQQGILMRNGQRIQRYGLQPDILISPTIKGIQAGKDEVLERAVKFLQTGR